MLVLDCLGFSGVFGFWVWGFGLCVLELGFWSTDHERLSKLLRLIWPSAPNI